MKTYQTLTLIGGIFGIVVVPIIQISIMMGLAFFSAFDESSELEPESLVEVAAYSVVISVIVSVIAIVIVFVKKETKPVGYILIGLAVIMLIVTSISGVISWVLFFVGGITAIQFKQVSDVKPKKINLSIDILKERYAKGEITKEEFDEMKEDLS